jgi:uncharacterized repeat protein (TIGR03803 family)
MKPITHRALTGAMMAALLAAASPAQAATYSFLASFSFTGTAQPEGGLIPESLGITPGAMIGTASATKLDAGSIILFAPPVSGSGPWSATVIHHFSGSDGSNPQGSLVFYNNALIGATFYGGSQNQGVLYSITANAGNYVFTKLMDFGTTTCPAALPHGSLVIGLGNLLYGTGGILQTIGNDGTVFALTPPHGTTGWSCQIITQYTSITTGASPQALYANASGTLFYAVNAGGAGGVGQVDALTPSGNSWIRTTLHSFSPKNNDGRHPLSQLYQDAAGALYGTTTAGGGKNMLGVFYKLSPPAVSGGAWSESILYAYPEGTIAGNNPKGQLYVNSAGVFYGATKTGGSANDGTVYSLTPQSGGGYTYQTLHSFTGTPTDGKFPYAGLELYNANTLIGITGKGGAGNNGSVYSLTLP